MVEKLNWMMRSIHHSNYMTDSPHKKRKLNQSALETNIQNFFECPVCFKSLYGEIYSCTNGHPLCQKCYRKLIPPKCPTCRSATIKRDHGLERLGTNIDMCPLFVCPHEMCDLTFTKQDLKKHLLKCRKMPWIYPLDFNQVFYDLATYVSFLKNDSLMVYHEINNFSEASLIKARFNEVVSPSSSEKVYHVYHCLEEKVIIYLIGSIQHSRFSYAVYYQIYPWLNRENNSNSICAETHIFLKKTSKLVRPKKKMYSTSLNISHGTINILDISDEEIRPDCDFTRSISLNYDIFRHFYNVSPKIYLNLTFNWFINNNQEIDDNNNTAEEEERIEERIEEFY